MLSIEILYDADVHMHPFQIMDTERGSCCFSCLFPVKKPYYSIDLISRVLFPVWIQLESESALVTVDNYCIKGVSNCSALRASYPAASLCDSCLELFNITSHPLLGDIFKTIVLCHFYSPFLFRKL